ncbi:SET domain-containing protein 4 [Choristoneura fumiferana]|uniref:SET domain-containing protein 4 n=1 Tax=Choristoneura fumiferana TaxID=7141 RepID=UPI003D154E3B
MGRTRRIRSQKARSFRTCSAESELIQLNSWLAKEGMFYNNKLVLAVFDATGRGVLTKKKITPGEELMNLPLNLTINVTSILMDATFCNIFLENKKLSFLEYKHSVSFQALMAFYLTFLRSQGKKSKWFVYLESLPKEYTVPYFLPNETKVYVDTDILAVITKQKYIIDTSFLIFKDILNHSTSEESNVIKFKQNFTLSIYEWAYFTVNTRCVYMDLSNVIDLKNVENSVLSLITDNTKISLCPFLDMINHSPNAKNETKLLVSKNIENISLTNLSQNLFSDVRFSIYTKNNFDPYTEVFICYGDSHNLKLITEYGFFLPANELDYVTFNFDDIIVFLKSKGIKLSQEQISFVNSHSLGKDLYIDLRGLSFNFYALLMVVKYFYDGEKDVSRLIYSAAICSNDRALNELITPMVEKKLSEIKEAVSKLESYENCVIINNCVSLMCQYVNILEKFIKC